MFTKGIPGSCWEIIRSVSAVLRPGRNSHGGRRLAGRSADLLFKVCGFSESIASRDDSGQIIAMSCLRPGLVRLAADDNTHIWEPEEPQTLKSRSALLAS